MELTVANPLPVAAIRFTLEWPRQIRCDPSPIEPSRLWNNLCTVDCAIEIVCIKSNAISQRLCTSQGLWIAPSDLWQSTLAIHQIPIKSWPFPLAK